jgi:DNA-binding response OmpR family regulator
LPAVFIEALELDLATGQARLDGLPVHLTDLEFRVLSYLIEHAGRVVPATELLRAVWKQEAGAPDNFDPVRSCIIG